MASEWAMGCWLGTLVISTAITVYTDCRWYWIPDCLVGCTALANGLALWSGLIGPDWFMALGVTIGMGLIHLLYPQGLGSGDVKLTAVLAMACSGQTAYIFMVTAFVSAACVGSLLWVMRRQAMIPFGPFLWLGWWLAFWQGEVILQWLGW